MKVEVLHLFSSYVILSIYLYQTMYINIHTYRCHFLFSFYQSLESLSLNKLYAFIMAFSNTEKEKTEQGHHVRFIKK